MFDHALHHQAHIVISKYFGRKKIVKRRRPRLSHPNPTFNRAPAIRAIRTHLCIIFPGIAILTHGHQHMFNPVPHLPPERLGVFFIARLPIRLPQRDPKRMARQLPRPFPVIDRIQFPVDHIPKRLFHIATHQRICHNAVGLFQIDIPNRAIPHAHQFDLCIPILRL